MPFVLSIIPIVCPFVGHNRPFARRRPAVFQAGFTLYEFMITLAIGAILLVVAAPNLSDFVRNNRITTTTNDLLAAIRLTRTETVKRGNPVILCRSANPTAANPACGGTAKTYTSGWIIYENLNSDLAYNAGTDVLISIHPPVSGVEIKSNSYGDNDLHFKADGTLDEGGLPAYAVCDGRGPDYGRLIVVALTGRARVIPTTAGGATTCAPGDNQSP